MKKRPCPHFGALLLDKPRGPSSGELVQWVRWALGTSAVGHCGTLDPDASGLMVLLVGKATRLASRLTAQQKGYRALFALGQATDTDDAQGSVIAQNPVSASMHEAAKARVRGAWEGRYSLLPPRYSAIRVGGVRAHKAARSGQRLELAARDMEIFRSSELDSSAHKALLAAHGGEPPVCNSALVGAELLVSKGSYIRSFAQELGRQVQSHAHLALLRRIQCGPAHLDDPRVLAGLSARPFTPSKDGAPRWRIRWGADTDEGKAAQAQRILAALIEPWELLGLAVRDPSSIRHAGEALALDPRAGDAAPWAQAWFRGQSLPVAHPQLQGVAQLPAMLWLDRDQAQAAILRRDPPTEQKPERWAPELVLSWSTQKDLRKPAPENATGA